MKNTITKIKNNLKKHYAFWLGLVIVFAISAITYHTDLFAITKLTERIASGDLDIYKKVFLGPVDMGYPVGPPLVYLVDALNLSIFNFLHLVPAIDSIGDVPQWWQLLGVKLRYILLFILSYPLIHKAALHFTNANEKESRKIANIWVTSPLLLYLPFAQGNNDIYPVFFSLIFLFFAFRKNYALAMFTLGLAACLKNYGVFLVLPMAIIIGEQDLRKTIKYVALAAAGYIIPCLPYLNDANYFLKSGGEGLYILKTVVPSITNYMVFPLLYFLLVLFLYFGNNKKEFTEQKNLAIVKYGFLTMSLFYIVSFYIAQWFLWILPFFAFIVYKNRKWFNLYVLIVSVFLVSLVTNWFNNLDLKLFSPITTSIKPGTPLYPDIHSANARSMVYTLFTALFLVLIYFFFKEAKQKEDLNKHYVLLNLLPLGVYLVFMAFAYFMTIR